MFNSSMLLKNVCILYSRQLKDEQKKMGRLWKGRERNNCCKKEMKRKI